MIKTSLVAVVATAICASSAAAQDLSAAELTALLKGNTAYLDLPDGPHGKGPAVIFYGADDKVAGKFPNGTAKGTWSVKGNTACLVWDGPAPNNPCAGYRKEGNKHVIFSLETKQPRAVITKLAPGNPEKL